MKVEEQIAVALHPPRCPKCGKEITRLVNICDQWMEYEFKLIDGDWDYILKNSEAGNHSEYGCPACRETLFYNEDDAISFLMGEEEPVLEEKADAEQKAEADGRSNGTRISNRNRDNLDVQRRA